MSAFSLSHQLSHLMCASFQAEARCRRNLFSRQHSRRGGVNQ